MKFQLYQSDEFGPNYQLQATFFCANSPRKEMRQSFNITGPVQNQNRRVRFEGYVEDHTNFEHSTDRPRPLYGW